MTGPDATTAGDAAEGLLTDGDRRALAVWASECAARVLPLFEARAPSDARPPRPSRAHDHRLDTGLRR